MAGIAKVMVIPRALYRVRQSSTSTRFGAEQDRIEESLDRMYRCIARIEEGRGYDDLLSQSTGDKLDPRVFLSHGSVLLWAGIRPRIFRRFLKRAKLSFDAKTAATAVWMAWASVSPATLRKFLLFLLAARNSAASGKIPTDRPLLWHPMRVIGRLRNGHPQQDDSISRVTESARK
jgi:hypothetical protein